MHSLIATMLSEEDQKNLLFEKYKNCRLWGREYILIEPDIEFINESEKKLFEKYLYNERKFIGNCDILSFRKNSAYYDIKDDFRKQAFLLMSDNKKSAYKKLLKDLDNKYVNYSVCLKQNLKFYDDLMKEDKINKLSVAAEEESTYAKRINKMTSDQLKEFRKNATEENKNYRKRLSATKQEQLRDNRNNSRRDKLAAMTFDQRIEHNKKIQLKRKIFFNNLPEEEQKRRIKVRIDKERCVKNNMTPEQKKVWNKKRAAYFRNWRNNLPAAKKLIYKEKDKVRRNNRFKCMTDDELKEYKIALANNNHDRYKNRTATQRQKYYRRRVRELSMMSEEELLISNNI